MTGDELKRWRTRAGFTQAEAADRLGVNSNTVARWERGEIPVSPAVDVLVNKRRKDTPAQYLRRVMREQELTIIDIVRRSGGRISSALLSNILHERARNPTIDAVVNIAKGIGRSPTEVFQAFCGESPDLARDLDLESVQRNYSLLSDKGKQQLKFVIQMLSREVNRQLRED